MRVEDIQAVFCINLTRRKDRWDAFTARLAAADWPLQSPMRFRATDGKMLGSPSGWQSGDGAWGCMCSHRRLLDELIHGGFENALILEDDAEFCPNFPNALRTSVSALPEPWDALLLGGQHMSTPVPAVGGLVKVRNSQRTHAMLVHKRYMPELLQRASAYQAHIDHCWGPLHGQRTVYAPDPFLIWQGANTSDIDGREHGRRGWGVGRESPVILIAPMPWDAAAPALADALQKTGVHFGYSARPPDWQDPGIRLIHDTAFPTPDTRALANGDSMKAMREWINLLSGEAANACRIVGAIHPVMPLLAEEWTRMLDGRLRLVVTHSPAPDETPASHRKLWEARRAWADTLPPERVRHIDLDAAVREPDRILTDLLVWAGGVCDPATFGAASAALGASHNGVAGAT